MSVSGNAGTGGCGNCGRAGGGSVSAAPGTENCGGAAPAAVLTAPGPALLDLRVTNGSTPYLGDRPLLTTVSPNRDGFRDVAIVHFRLLRPATVRLEVVATNMVSAGKGGTTIVCEPPW